MSRRRKPASVPLPPRRYYTNRELAREYLRDLVVEIRCGLRDGLNDYAEEMIRKFRSIWPSRHRPRIGRYGEPEPPVT